MHSIWSFYSTIAPHAGSMFTAEARARHGNIVKNCQNATKKGDGAVCARARGEYGKITARWKRCLGYSEQRMNKGAFQFEAWRKRGRLSTKRKDRRVRVLVGINSWCQLLRSLHGLCSCNRSLQTVSCLLRRLARWTCRHEIYSARSDKGLFACMVFLSGSLRRRSIQTVP